MPQKGKGKEPDKGGKPKRKVPPPLVPPPEPVVFTDDTKEFYILLIKDLTDVITKYETLRSELEAKNADLLCQLKYLNDKKLKSVVELEEKLSSTDQEIEELNGLLSKLRADMEAERLLFEQKLLAIKTEHMETEAELLAENLGIQAQIDSLLLFLTQRRSLLQRVYELTQALLDQDVEHKHNVYLLDRKQVQARDRLKKDMIAQVIAAAAEFHRSCQAAMTDTTKRTLQENYSIVFQVKKMTEKSEELIEENRLLMQRDNQQRSQLEMLEHMEVELSRKNVNIKKAIFSLSEICYDQSIALAENNAKGKDITKYELKMESLVNELLQSREKMKASVMDCTSIEEQVTEAKMNLDERFMMRRRVERTLADAAEAVKIVITDTSASESCTKSTLAISHKRAELLESLIRVMNGAANNEVKLTAPDVSSVVASNLGLHGKSMLSQRYKSGDLGFITATTERYITSVERMKNSRKSQENALLRFAQKSAGADAAGAKKPISFMDQLMCRYSLGGIPPEPADDNTEDGGMPSLTK